MTQEQKQTIADFLSSHHMAVIATNAGLGEAPESALMVFSEDKDLHIFLGSDKDRRKNFNIKNNPKISMVVGLDYDEGITLQLEGIAKIVTDVSRINYMADIHYKKNPKSAKYRDRPVREYIEFVPTLFKYTNITKQPYESWECNTLG
jgi:general stress protein 26